MKKVKILALLMALVMVLGMLAGCGGSSNDGQSNSSTGNSTSASDSTSQDTGKDTGKDTTDPDDPNNKTKIAVFLPLTGDFKQYGDAIQTGIELGINTYNAEHGTNYSYEVFDDKGDPNESVNIANLIVSDGSYFAAMGSYTSSCAMATVPVFEEANMVLYSPTGSHEDFPLMSPITFGIGISKKYDCVLFSEELVKRYPEKKTMAIVYQNTDNGVVVEKTTRSAFTNLGGEVLLSETFTPNQTNDFTPLLSKVKESGADILYVEAGYVDTAKIFNQAVGLGMNPDNIMFLTNGTSLKPEFLDLVGEKGNGIIFLTTMASYQKELLEGREIEPHVQKFLDDCKNIYGIEEPDAFVCQGYDAVTSLLNAAGKVGHHTEDLLKQIPKLEDFKPVSGQNLYYNENKEMIKNYQYAYIVMDGTFLFLDNYLANQK